MKKLYYLLLGVLITTLGESCRKHDESENYLRGILDGQKFEASYILANKPEPVQGISLDPSLKIAANFSSYTIGLMILDEFKIKEGVYNFRSDKHRSATIIVNGMDNYYAGNGGIYSNPIVYGSGSITITEVSKKYVKGSFEFTAVNSAGNSKTITNGEFSIVRN